MSMTELANFLGWCTLLNFALLAFATMMLVAARKPVTKIHGRWFHLEPSEFWRSRLSHD